MLFDVDGCFWDLNRIRGMVQIKINGRISEWVMSNPKRNDMVILKWLHFIFEDCYFFAIRKEKFIPNDFCSEGIGDLLLYIHL